ncbi:DoxX family protein [Nocardioides sp. SYSU DS0651]|uniref:DoxX family protein n=1 Tax=Nocardioides sp. SYSU DS0651 TaxID=3415955 RepID=UPI003F4C8250
MDILAWILTGVLAAAMLVAGLTKALVDREKLLENPAMLWSADFAAGQVKAIGVLEVVGAAGLVLPWLLDIAPVLSPVAAVGLALILAGAVVVHLRRGEKQAVVVPAALLVLAVAVAVLRFSQL